MDAAGVQVRDGNGCRLGKLVFEAQRALHGVRRCQIGIDSINGGANGLGAARERGQRGHAGIETRIVHYHLLPGGAIELLCLEQHALRQAVIKDAKAGPQHRLGLSRAAGQTPGKAQAGSEIPMLVHAVLCLIAQAIAQGHLRANSPIVRHEEACVHVGDY